MSQNETLARPASVHLRRRIEWMDTDAAGIYHWTTVFRLAEAAEAVLHTALGIEHLSFGVTPRLSVTFDFKSSLRFNDVVDVILAVDRLGRTSIRYAIVVTGPGGVAAEGHITSCLVDRESGRPAPWPEDWRRLFGQSGDQTQNARGGSPRPESPGAHGSSAA